MAPRGDAGLHETAGTDAHGDGGSSERLRSGGELPADEFVWLIGSLASLHQVPFDPALLAQRYVPPHTRAQLEEALHALGIATRNAAIEGPETVTVGQGAFALAWLHGATPRAAPEPALVVRASPEAILLFRALADQPESLAPAQFRQRLSGPLIVTTRRVAEPADPDSAAQRPRFGFRWFVPELVKHKRLWRDVLLASGAIQLLALGMPLMTQAIIENPAQRFR
jgi:subfamily B ATP-binding cassette protein HlyB/CyaB